MSGSTSSLAYVRPSMLRVCAVRLRVAIWCLVCPLVMVLVERVAFVGYVSVASIAYVTVSAIEIT